MIRIERVILLLLAATAVASSQQVLVLTSGTQLEGRYDGGKPDTVYFIDERGDRHKFHIYEIQSLTFSPPPPPPAPAAPPSAAAPTEAFPAYPPAAPANFVERGYADTDQEPAAGWSRYGVIPAGAQVVVRTIDPIDVREPDPRQHFLASVDQDVLDASGNVVIPKGSTAHLIVHKVGGGDIAVDLRSVEVNGRRLILNSEILTNTRTRDGVGANKRTGAFLGGGALLGTILGAVAGGGRGAAIGAVAGGAAGAGTEVLTRGHALHIPSETILRFQLEQPVYVYQ